MSLGNVINACEEVVGSAAEEIWNVRIFLCVLFLCSFDTTLQYLIQCDSLLLLML